MSSWSLVIGLSAACGVIMPAVGVSCFIFYYSYFFDVVWSATICDDNDGSDGVYFGGIQCGSGM